MNLKIAITLTRGYPTDKLSYETLIQRNIAIFEKINKFRDRPADLLIFHEDNLSGEVKSIFANRVQRI